MFSTATGLIKVTDISKEQDGSVFSVVVEEKNTYPNTSGEYEGSYGRTFITTKFFANNDKRKQFVENVLKKAEAEKRPVTVETRYQNKKFNGEYRDEFIAVRITPYL